MIRTSLALIPFTLTLALLHCGGQNSADSPAAAPTIAPAELPPVPTTGPDAGPPADAAPAVAPTTDGGAPEAANTLTDAQIAGVTDTANSAEIEQGEVARLKSKDKDVQKFAARMIAAHEEAKKNQDKLKLPTAESALGNTFGTAAASTLASLKTSEGATFDKTYIDAQVSAHQQLLDALNDKLLPTVKNPDLKAYLNQITPHVAQHLKAAQAIQRSLASKTAAAPTTEKPAAK
jgi:putative membrane protein